MEITDKIKIKKCDLRPELVGENAEIVDLQVQELEKYRQYPLWAKILTGEHAGKVYGFKEGDVSPLSAETSPYKTSKATNTRLISHLETIIKEINTVEDMAEVERVIEEAKGKIVMEPDLGYWEGKTPCWEMFRCPQELKNECPAYKYKSLPCWEIQGTYCKLGGANDGTEVCLYCRVYKKWGNNEPIRIKLGSKGFSNIW